MILYSIYLHSIWYLKLPPHAQFATSIGVWSKALSKELLSSATVQDGLTAVRNTLKRESDLPVEQFPQYISNGFPEVAWAADVEYEGGFLGKA